MFAKRTEKEDFCLAKNISRFVCAARNIYLNDIDMRAAWNGIVQNEVITAAYVCSCGNARFIISFIFHESWAKYGIHVRQFFPVEQNEKY